MLVKQIPCEVEYAQAEMQVCDAGGCSLIKTASTIPDIFDGVEIKKNHAYLYVIAMGAGDYYGCNLNGDFFWEEDLKKYHHKFLTSGVFIGHDNKDPNKSKGKVLKSVYNNKMHRVELLIEVKKALAPEVYYAIQNGERISVSMGVRVTTESCSYCGKITKDSLANRCEHLKHMMHKIMPNGVKVCAINHPPLNFFDISIVRKPADHQGYAMFQKVASYHEKTASDKNSNYFNINYSIQKIAAANAITKEADLIKRIEAVSATAPLKFSDIQELKSIPEPILKAFFVKHNIMLKLPEVIGLGFSVDENMYNDMCCNIDTPEAYRQFIIKTTPMLSGIKQKLFSFASVPSEFEDKYDSIKRLIGREFLVKEASNSAYSHIKPRDYYGHKPIYIKSKLPFVRDYAGYRLVFNNGESIVVSNSSLLTNSLKNYKEMIQNGSIETVAIVLPTGREKVVYHQGKKV